MHARREERLRELQRRRLMLRKNSFGMKFPKEILCSAFRIIECFSAQVLCVNEFRLRRNLFQSQTLRHDELLLRVFLDQITRTQSDNSTQENSNEDSMHYIKVNSTTLLYICLQQSHPDMLNDVKTMLNDVNLSKYTYTFSN